MIRRLLFLLCTLALVASCSDGFSSYAAPAIEAPLLIGEGSFNLKNHLETDGRPILLNLWASWCGPCRDEMPALDTAASANPDVSFVGIAVLDREDEAIEFLNEMAIRFPNALDRDGTVADSLGVIGLPITLIIDEDGMVIDEFRGPLDTQKIDDLLP